MPRMPYALVPLALLLAAPPGLAAGKRHPAVGADVAPDACITCHSERTPKVVQQWESGQHGLVLVKCFVCHGSTGKDFTTQAAVARCQGCHAAEVASLAPVKAKAGARPGAECFSCHEPHTLAVPEGGKSPHGAQAR